MKNVIENIDGVTTSWYEKLIHNFVMETDMYQSYGGNILSKNPDGSGYSGNTGYGNITNAKLENFIQNLFNTFPVNSGLRDVTIQMLNMMREIAKDSTITNELDSLGVTEAIISQIDSSYVNDGHLSILQPIVGSYNGVPQYETSLGKTIQFSLMETIRLMWI